MNKALNSVVSALMANLLSSRRLKSKGFVLALLGLGAAALFTLNPAEPSAGAQTAQKTAFQLQGRVIRIADGDTFTLSVGGRQEKIRMASIDAPELTKSHEQPGQPLAQASKDALAKLIAGKTLTLDCYERDRYDRNVCDVPLNSGRTANQQQVASGMAWANTEGRGKFMRDAALQELQEQARQAKLGIWGQAGAIKPWVWRYDCWKKSRC